MSLVQDPEPLFFLARFGDQARHFSESLVQQVAASFSTATCASDATEEACRDDAAALRLKLVGMGTILVLGVVGVATPLVGRKRRLVRTDGSLFVFAKAFAAGVILATGFVHMLHDAQEALTDPCLPETPWRRFPFPGFIAMLAALGTLVADFLGTQFYERKHREETMGVKVAAAAAIAAAEEDHFGITVVAEEPEPEAEVEGVKSPMHIVGMHAHAAAHRHSHPHGHETCDARARSGHAPEHAHAHEHEHAHEQEPEVPSHVRHVVVSQILELGIVSHSVIIGLSLGVSQSPCTIRPLVAALSFHQFFEGFALGGCISQAQFRNLAATLMACCFAITTPTGIAVGAGMSSFYNANSPRALVVEGILDSISSGILIYMALVDLIAADFLSRKMSCNVRLQVTSYLSLFLGAGCMSALALWA